MASIKSASRSALVAFAPDAPFLAAGTLAGAVDLSFSSSANLEIFNMDFQSDAQDLTLAGSTPSPERFNRLSWGKVGSLSEEYSMGLLAGGMVDGSINVWNPLKLMKSPGSDDINKVIDDSVVAALRKHSGPVCGLEFSGLSPNLLASGADEGELCIWDLANPLAATRYPSLKNPGSSIQGEISYVSWNSKFHHIIASTSYNGTTVVWDLKHQKPVTSISDLSKRRCSVLQWNPDISTQLIVASDDDASPSLKLWDVRKTISPIKEFVGHTKGVIAMSWCSNDSSLLLTCAKDNRTICWDTVTGEIFSELPASTNWNFDIHWYTKIPGIISASSFDGKIGIYNIEAYSRSAAVDGDFGSQARLRAPKWLKCPSGMSYGFGGKIVSCRTSSTPSGAPCSSEVYVHNVVTEDSLVKRSTEFEAAVHSGEKSALRLLCERKSEESVLEDDKEAWAFLKIMFEDEGTARTKLLGHLGFSVPSTEDENLSELTSGHNLEDSHAKTTGLMEGSAFHIDNGEEFFNNVQSSVENLSLDKDTTNGEQALQEPQGTQEPVVDVDESILHALIVGDYKGAVQHCVSANRVADALIIANASGPSSGPPLWESTRDKYLNKSHLPYLKVVDALVKNDLMAVVNTRPLNLWKETMALLCTFAQKEEWTELCDSLASRLMIAGSTLAATLCYICAGNIDKTVEIWSYKLTSENGGRTYADLIQDLMEKVIVVALATGQKQFSASLSKLVENYAELLVSQGLLTTALGCLKLLGTEDSSEELVILQNRILLSVEERELPNTQPTVSALNQSEPTHVSEQPVVYSQDNTQFQQPNVPQYVEPYTQPAYPQQMAPYPGYPPPQQKTQFPDYANPTPFQPSPSPQMFLPSQTQNHQVPSVPPVSMPQPALRPFIPATPAALKNVEQYQTPTLGSQLYSGGVPSAYQPGQPGQPGQGTLGGGGGPTATIPSMAFGQSVTSAPTPGGFSPVTNPGFVQSSGGFTAVTNPGFVQGSGGFNPVTNPGFVQSSGGFTPVTNPGFVQSSGGFTPVSNPGFVQSTGRGPVQPSSPTQATHTQTVSAPPAPPPTVQTVDTSNVTAELRPVITTLTRLYNETSEALGGSRANPAKKREIDDNSKKIGSLFAKLNNQDISSNASSKLVQLCLALDNADFPGALHVQVVLTTTEWDECNFWLAALKRMIKTRQSMRPH